MADKLGLSLLLACSLRPCLLLGRHGAYQLKGTERQQDQDKDRLVGCGIRRIRLTGPGIGLITARPVSATAAGAGGAGRRRAGV